MTTENTFYVKQSTLVAMALLATKHDPRYYLNGVCVEFNDKITKVLATNGHILGAHDSMPATFCDDFNQGKGVVIVPHDALAKLPKLSARHDPVIKFTQREPELFPLVWTMSVNGVEIVFDACDAKFPDWRRVVASLVDKGTTGEPSGFNLGYLNDLEKCGTILAGGKKLKTENRTIVYQNGNEGALVRFADDDLYNFAGVIMPLRNATGKAGTMFPASIAAPI
jgi:DNA polymerase III subunit beta